MFSRASQPRMGGVVTRMLGSEGGQCRLFMLRTRWSFQPRKVGATGATWWSGKPAAGGKGGGRAEAGLRGMGSIRCLRLEAT